MAARKTHHPLLRAVTFKHEGGLCTVDDPNMTLSDFVIDLTLRVNCAFKQFNESLVAECCKLRQKSEN